MLNVTRPKIFASIAGSFTAIALAMVFGFSQVGATEDVYYWEPGMPDCGYLCVDGLTPGCSCIRL